MTRTRSHPEKELRQAICELLSAFYHQGWVAGTGGGICAVGRGSGVLMAPTGVHKEWVRPEDLFVVDREGAILRPPRDRSLKLTECQAIFSLLIRQRGAGSVMHSHALSSVLAGDLAAGRDRLVFEKAEMLKGIRGVSNQDRHAVPVIRNTPREPELVSQIEKSLARPDFDRGFCLLVEDHGAYIWGADLWETKRHAEVYHFLFELTVARNQSARNRGGI